MSSVLHSAVVDASLPLPIDDHRAERLQQLADSIRHAAHYLPAQGPITSFVHHNTLHAFEHLPFEQAVVAAAELYGCHPYLAEEDYRQRMASGRITPQDIEAVLIEDLGDAGDELLGFLGTRFALRRHMLSHPLRTGTPAEIRWVMAETEALSQFREETPPAIKRATIAATRAWVLRDLAAGGETSPPQRRARAYVERLASRFGGAPHEGWSEAEWESLTLHLLWMICRDGVSHSQPYLSPPPRFRRHRDGLLAQTGQDSDELINSLLIPFCAAWVDQGFAHWGIPRETGLWATFSTLARQPWAPAEGWRRGLDRELARIAQQRLSPLEVIDESLDRLGLAHEEREPYVLQTLLALRGYAGMLWQLESRCDWAVRTMPPGTLEEYLAVRLVVERFALEHIARESLEFRGSLAALGERLREEEPDNVPSLEQRALLVFQLAQVEGLYPQTMYRLRPQEWQWVVREIEAFSRLERRRIYHLAFERRYRREALDAIVVHRAREGEGPPRGLARDTFQIVCCLDEREESFRRHLEEVAPDCRTFGAAGFFSIPMFYRGADHAHFTPLAPIVVKPQHYVAEKVVGEEAEDNERRRRRRRALGKATRRAHLGSRTFAGGWVAGVLGSLASFPLVMRVFFPRLTANVGRRAARLLTAPPRTRLELRAVEDHVGTEKFGFEANEMATMVERMLREIGLTKGFARLVVVCGHGSSSLNNPHLAAYNCGACSGNPGGPNARAFAQMAGDPEVRQLLAERGVPIPADTHFVGAYHNTCDDSVTYFDLERVPDSHHEELEQLRRLVDEARQRNAHERCRRFESAPLDWPPERALEHVEARAEDLSQARPELGHATNVLCLVGRREWSRGLFLDRRAFLQSYDPSLDDPQHHLLERVLQAVVPVCAGINLEYFFSYVDPVGYGCGTKLPHNVVSLLGVMNGAASDLRTGLPWQMVEIHEPLRLLMVVETTPQAMLGLMARNPGIDRLVRGDWVQVATYDPASRTLRLFQRGEFRPYKPQSTSLPRVPTSSAWYGGRRDHLGFASVETAIVRKGKRS